MKLPHHTRFIAILLPLILLIAVMLHDGARSDLRQLATNGTPPSVNKSSAETKPSNVPVGVDDTLAQKAFRDWFQEYRGANDSKRITLLPSGLEMASQRRVRMARLIREEPEAALKEALRLDEYDVLPENLRALVERPFSAVAAYDYYPVCGAPVGTADHVAELSLPDGKFDAYTYGRRAGVMSKRSIPVQGVTLDGAAALHTSALRELEASEIATAKKLFPNAQADPTRSFLSGEVIAGEPIVALAGGRLYQFANRDELERLNEALAKLEDLPGPNAGSDVLYQAKAADGSSGFDLPAAQVAEQFQADAWTEQVKKVFIIRVDFSDLAGAAYAQAATATNLNGVISDQVRAMSYGKTWINAGVSANVYRMPQTSAFYVNGTTGSSLNSELLRDARNTIRNTRSGGDAAIDIGPVSNNTNGDGSGLGTYDIVGVLFASMNMRSTITYAGLAGGGNIWMQGTISAGVFTHEFGHNYGIGHSGFWQTSDGSVLGTGSNVEYGDDFDIMGGGEVPKGHFHPQAKAKLNWLSASEWSDATAAGSATYRVHRIDSQFTTGMPRGVRITRSVVSGSEEYLWLGFRPLYTGIPFLERGAYMVWQRPGQTRSWLVDTTPATSGVKTDAPIPLGRTFADATSNAFITPLAVGGTGDNAYLDVRVNFGPYPGNAVPTAGSITGPSTVAARSSALYSITANDSNGDTLAYSWDTGDGSVPGNASSIVQSWTVGGSYTLGLTVSDMKGGTLPLTKSITVTDPLDTWTTGSVGSSEYLDQIIYAKARFVSSEYFGTVFMSWDGIAWTNVGALPDMDQPKLAYGAGVFVAAGIKESANTTAQICYSPDGRRWKTATFPNGVPMMKAVSFGNGRFIAAGEDGTVLSSTDGITWSVLTVPGLPDFRHIVWTGSAWVAVAMHPTNARPEVVWTSPDAVTWTERTARGFDVYKVVAQGGKCYALGWYGGVVYSSDSGITWQDTALPAGTRWTTYLMAAAPDGTLLCTARAMDEPGTSYALLVSTDGQRWVRASGNTAVVNADALAFADGRFITVEDAGVIRRSATFYPTNAAPVANFTTAPATGTARQPIYLAASGTDANGDTLTYAWDFGAQADVQDGFEIAPTFAFGGPYSLTLRISDARGAVTTLNHTITISDPARTFTQRTSGTTEALNALNSNGITTVAAGGKGVIRTSTDGQTWTTRSVSEFVGNLYFQDVVWDGSQFVLVGYDYDFGLSGWVSVIYTSPTGTTWTRRLLGTAVNTRLYAVASSGGGVLVACGQSGTVLRSTNGTAWNSVSGFGTSTLEGAARSSTHFVITGHASGGSGTPTVWTSFDGLSWIDTSAGAGVASWQDIRRIAWLNDRFVGSGWYSKLRVSTDNGSTFTTTRAVSEQCNGLAYGSGVYFTAGINQDASNADIDLLSLNGTDWFTYPAPTTADRNAALFFNNTFITVGNAGSIWQSGTLTGATGFAAWQTTNFPSGGLLALADRDPDLDGLSNLAEYAMNLAPNAPNGALGYPVLQSGRAWLHLDVPQSPPADARLIIQGSLTLSGGSWTELARKTGTGAWIWQAGGTTRISAGSPASGRVPTEIGMPDSQVGQPRYFMRLVVEQL